MICTVRMNVSTQGDAKWICADHEIIWYVHPHPWSGKKANHPDRCPVDKAIAAERERCAKIALSVVKDEDQYCCEPNGEETARRIRSGE